MAAKGTSGALLPPAVFHCSKKLEKKTPPTLVLKRMGSHRGCAVVAKEYARSFPPPAEISVLFRSLKRKKIRRKNLG